MFNLTTASGENGDGGFYARRPRWGGADMA